MYGYTSDRLIPLHARASADVSAMPRQAPAIVSDTQCLSANTLPDAVVTIEAPQSNERDTGSCRSSCAGVFCLSI